MMDAAEAERSGLVARVVPAADLLAEAMKAAETIASMFADRAGQALGAAGAGDHPELDLGLAELRGVGGQDEEAERSGLVARVVPAADLLAEAMKAAETIASMSLPAVTSPCRPRGSGAGCRRRRGSPRA
jgi:enoyl-CoA hydratase/carnithine racemase